MTATRTLGLIEALTNANVMTFADKGYQGVDGTNILDEQDNKSLATTVYHFDV